MNVIRGVAQTDEASRIVRRLSRHWSHKYPVQMDETSGVIELPDVKLTLQAAAGQVEVTMEARAAEVPLRLTGVVAEHMQRMASEGQVLDVRWTGPDG